MSPSEQAFLRSLLAARSEHMQSALLKDLPDGLDTLAAFPALFEGPNTRVFVCAHVLEDVGGEIPDLNTPADEDGGRGSSIVLNKGDSLAILYSNIAPYVRDKRVTLL